MDLGPISSAPPAPPCAPVEVSEQRPAAEGLRGPGSRGGRWNADGSAASTRASRTAKEFKTEARAASPLASRLDQGLRWPVRCPTRGRFQTQRPAAPAVFRLAQRAVASVGPTGTRSGFRIGLCLSGLSGERRWKRAWPPDTVWAEIRSAHRFHVSAWWSIDWSTSLV